MSTSAVQPRRTLYVETIGKGETQRHEIRELLLDGDHSVLAIVYTTRAEAITVMGAMLR